MATSSPLNADDRWSAITAVHAKGWSAEITFEVLRQVERAAEKEICDLEAWAELDRLRWRVQLADRMVEKMRRGEWESLTARNETRG